MILLFIRPLKEKEKWKEETFCLFYVFFMNPWEKRGVVGSIFE